MKYPLSMTAFGRGDASNDQLTFIVEITSVNHRYCDIKIKIPYQYSAFEEKVRKEIQAHYSRGHINVFITVTGKIINSIQLTPNLPLAREYYNCLQAIQQELNLDEQPTLTMLKDCKDVITLTEHEQELDEIWSPMRTALTTALTNCDKMRQAEGKTLKNDLLTRLNNFTAIIDAIKTNIPELLLKKEKKLKERLDNLLVDVDIDSMRLMQEVAVMVDKSDVTEELVRLTSHVSQFTGFLEFDEPVGRRVDFLLQEFLREINTLAAKINDVSVAHRTVDLKSEIEKMREQVQNLE